MRDGTIGPMQVDGAAGGTGLAAIEQRVTPEMASLFHVHPQGASPLPSDADIAAAKRIKIPIMVLSRDGLYEIDALGHVTQAERGLDWMNVPKMKKK